MFNLALVFAGGGLGAVVRYAAGIWLSTVTSNAFPWPTLIVNASGSLLLGMLTGWLAVRGDVSNAATLLLAVGFLGGFTTFSAFTLDTLMLWQRQAYMEASVYVLVSVGVSLLAMLVGLWLSRLVTGA